MVTVEQVKRVVDQVYLEVVDSNDSLDSLALLEIIIAVEDELKVEIDDFKAEGLTITTQLEDIPQILFNAIVHQ